jgi:nicotinate-nucleotide adenylyltransferase
MLTLATSADPRLCISTFELERDESQYTVDTLFHFRSQLGESVDLFFVMGADSWAEITSWREWQRLLTLANLIVVTRPGHEFSAEHVGPVTASSVLDLRGVTEVYQERSAQKIFVTDAVMLDVSATEVRTAARENLIDSLEKLVPLEVADYIKKYKLYRNQQ